MSPQLNESTYEAMKEFSEYKPENYRLSGNSIPSTSSSSEINLRNTFNWQGKSQFAPIMRLRKNTRNFNIPRPITVHIYRDEDLFFAENETLVVCGTGDTPQEAFSDFCLHIVHFFDYYKKLDRNKLIGDALRLKELYQDLLIEVKE